jgi:tetratricopeptide (TPR) repeat protein
MSCLVLLLAVATADAQTDRIKGESSITTANGFTRILLHFKQEVSATVRLTNNILVVSFSAPVDVPVDRLVAGAPDIVGAARRDPDGKGLRVALKQKLRANTMPAGNRLFIDLLPETWTGVPPGLPQDVVDELAQRARDAEKNARLARLLEEQRRAPAVPVRVSRLPTFTRYTFRLPDKAGVASDRNADMLNLRFDVPIKFDIADALADLPPNVASIKRTLEPETVAVRFTFKDTVDVRTFREDGNYVVDVAKPRNNTHKSTPQILEGLGQFNEVEPAGDNPPKSSASESLPPKASPPETIPARSDRETEQKVTVALPPKPVTSLATKPAAAAPQEAPPAASAVAEPKPVPAKTEQAAGNAPPAKPKAPPAGVKASGGGAVLPVTLIRRGPNLRVVIPYAAPVPAAVFRRADTIWMVFESPQPLDVAALNADPSKTIANATTQPIPNGMIVRVRLQRPRLASAAPDGDGWAVMIGDLITAPTQPLALERNVSNPAHASAVIPFEDPRQARRLHDPALGDDLIVVTALGPARGLLTEQDFVEFHALASVHGVVIQPLADDVTAELSPDRIVIARPKGLTLSAESTASRDVKPAGPIVLSNEQWAHDEKAKFEPRLRELIGTAADAPAGKRLAPRMNVARFYLARDMPYEAKGVLDVALQDAQPTPATAPAIVLRAICSVLAARPSDALKDLDNSLVGEQFDSRLWRAMAQAEEARWPDAYDGFSSTLVAASLLPITLQRKVMMQSARTSIAVNDFSGAAKTLNDLETIGVDAADKPAVALLTGSLSEGLGRPRDALADYQVAAKSKVRPAEALGRLREIILRLRIGELDRKHAVDALESLALSWRGDRTEVETLAMLVDLYTKEGRYRDAFSTMHTALVTHPGSETTRRIQDSAAGTFDTLFLTDKGDSLSPIDALSLFYDFRELTPIGRRGDEIIRRLAERLVTVDLLQQASKLLQYQVDNRLQGAAKAQVATRLAVIYLMNRQPTKALQALHQSRTADLSNELHDQRLLLEARALSETGRHDLALEIVADLQGTDAIKLRADINWSARRWDASADQIELLLAKRWSDWGPLTPSERMNVLRAAVGYALANDAIGLGRLHEKFAAKMNEGPDRHAFDVVTAQAGASSPEFREVAQKVAASDTLSDFLKDLKTRYPETANASSADDARDGPSKPVMPGRTSSRATPASAAAG